MSHRTATRISLGLCLVVACAANAAERLDASRVVAFGDVHGAYEALVELLTRTGVVGPGLDWQADDTHLVSLGDLLDRGPDSRKVIDLLRRLEPQAAAAGGRVHVLMGNHELMTLTGDLRYVSEGERSAFAELAPPVPEGSPGDGLAGLRAAYAPDAEYGAWLLQRPATVVINDTAFVHGGLSPQMGGYRPETVTREAHRKLEALLTLRRHLEANGLLPAGMEVNDAAQRLEAALPADVEDAARRFVALVRDPLFSGTGPFWYRGNARCHPLIEQPSLRRILDAWNATRVVVGHTPTLDLRVHTRLDGLAVLADTGMLSSHYGGRASAVILEGTGVQVVYGDEDAGPTQPRVDDGRPLFPLDESQVLTALAGFEAPPPDWHALHVSPAERAAARVVEASPRQRDAELAAMRLDRLLGLNLVLPVSARDDGVAVAAWPGVISESERVDAAIGVPDNPCAESSALQLLYAFDALIGNEGRLPGTILYDRRTWRLGSIGHGQSFGRSGRLPAYLDKAPHHMPAALADRLRSLDVGGLRELLGDLLNRGRIRGILNRRDKLLETWSVEG